MTPERIPFGPGVIILGGGALFLSAALFLGFLLPTDWEADASVIVPATPEAVFGYLDSPEGWRAWTHWPDSGLIREGPPRGVDARIRWDDPELGSGSFRLVAVQPHERVTYAVEVGGGAMRTEGSVALAVEGSGVRVTWHEEGNLGRNPLMGYWAFFMDRAQATELEKGLARLRALLAEESAAEAPADSVEADAA